MRKRIRYCARGRHYTLREECHDAPTILRAPPRYTPHDTYQALKSRAFAERVKLLIEEKGEVILEAIFEKQDTRASDA